ncbi:phage tail assembly protein [Variovorax sp. DAIF25]|uniref:phage tail assembly protein n=1 Tax=Variovorax sp. DAIF25 TaxID=3080983 RepID=UPI003D6AE0AE
MTRRRAARKLGAMHPQPTPITSAPGIPDLFSLTLVDGLPVDREGAVIRYRTVRLRETGIAEERAAIRQAERVATVGGVAELLVSRADFSFAMTVLHIESFECDGAKIPAAVIDGKMVGKLSEHDFRLIEQRVYLIELAAQVRYGVITREDFHALSGGVVPSAAPQPVGQTSDVGANAAAGESGPQMLNDFAGAGAAGAPAVDAR